MIPPKIAFIDGKMTDVHIIQNLQKYNQKVSLFMQQSQLVNQDNAKLVSYEGALLNCGVPR